MEMEKKKGGKREPEETVGGARKGEGRQEGWRLFFSVFPATLSPETTLSLQNSFKFLSTFTDLVFTETII